MDSRHRRSSLFFLLLLLLVLVTANPSSAQSPSNNNNNNNNLYLSSPKFNPSMAIVIVILIAAFFFLGFFSIYVRQCAGGRSDNSRFSVRGGARGPATGRTRVTRGLDPSILATFPTLVYSDVREHKIGKGSLECAVCLSEFDDDETLRLLPKCSHVFHPDCIDAWLAAHVTCPVCRCNLEEVNDDDDPKELNLSSLPAADATQLEIAATTDSLPQVPLPEQQQQVTIDIDPEDQKRIADLERFVNLKRAGSRARPARFPRSHSTGHSLVSPGEDLDRFTLRLPENIRREIVERAGMMQRARSMVAFPSEESSRRGFRAGGSKSIKLGRSDRWGSFLKRTLSTKMGGWGRRGGDADEGSTSTRRGVSFFKRGDSVRRGDSSMKGEGSVAKAGKFMPVITPLDSYAEGSDDTKTPSAAVINRV